MSRLPTVGGDDNTWGNVLNDFLGVEHNADGTLKKASDIADAKAKADTAVQSVNSKTGNSITLNATDVGAINISALDTDATMAANSDNRVPSQKAIRAYVAADGGSVPLVKPSGDTSGAIDTAALQAALDNNGGFRLVWSPSLPYWLNSGLTLPANAGVFGAGKGSILKPVAGANITVLSLASVNNNQITLRDFQIDGNKANQSSGYGIVIDNSSGVFLNDQDSHNLFSDVLIRNVKNDGFTFKGDSNQTPRAQKIIDCEAYYCDGVGFVVGASDQEFTSCVAGNNGLQGFNIIQNSGNVQLVNCKSFGSGQVTPGSGYGFATIGTVGTYVNCQAQDNLASGFYIDWYENSFTGCVADRNAIGFEVGGNVLRTFFTGCVALNSTGSSQTYGWQIDAGADYLLAGGYTWNNATGSVNNLSSGTHIDLTQLAAW